MKSSLSKVHQIIKQRQFNIISSANGGLIRLFWETGYCLNSLYNERGKRFSQSLVSDIGQKLSGLYGDWFDKSNIESMRVFNKIFPDYEKISALNSYVGWDHIKLLLPVKNEDNIVDYLNFIIENQITPGELEKVLSRGAINTKPVYNMKRFTGIQGVFNLFKNGNFDLLKNVLNPAKNKIYLDEEEKEVFIKIRDMIGRFSGNLIPWINSNFIGCCWEVGEEISQMFPAENMKSDYYKIFAEKISEEMPGLPGAIFDEKGLKQLSDFYRHFPKNYFSFYFSDLITWPYLEYLLKLNDPRAVIFYSRKIAKERLSISKLKKEIDSKVFENSPDFFVKESEYLEILKSEERDVKVRRKGNNISVIVSINISFKDIPKGFIRVGHLFKNPYREFLTAYIP